jgi:hypothetical protein
MGSAILRAPGKQRTYLILRFRAYVRIPNVHEVTGKKSSTGDKVLPI